MLGIVFIRYSRSNPKLLNCIHWGQWGINVGESGVFPAHAVLSSGASAACQRLTNSACS